MSEPSRVVDGYDCDLGVRLLVDCWQISSDLRDGRWGSRTWAKSLTYPVGWELGNCFCGGNQAEHKNSDGGQARFRVANSQAKLYRTRKVIALCYQIT